MDIPKLRALVRTVVADTELPAPTRIEILQGWIAQLTTYMFSVTQTSEELKEILGLVDEIEDNIHELED